MNLNERKREEHRGRILERIGSVLVCMSVLLASAFPPQPACAVFVADDAAIAAVVPAFLSSCGMTFSASGMDSNGVKDQVGHVIDDYLNMVMGGKSAMEWFGDVTIGYSRGMMSIPSVLANKIADFAEWVQEKYSVQAGQAEPITIYNGNSLLLQNGASFLLSQGNLDSNGTSGHVTCLGTVIQNSNLPMLFQNGSMLKYDNNFTEFYASYGKLIYRFGNEFTILMILPNNEMKFAVYLDDGRFMLSGDDVTSYFYDVPATNESFSLSANADTLSIPETIPDDKDVVITTGAAEGVSYDEMLNQILAAIAAGQLATTKEIADAGTATGTGELVEPVVETMPVIGELGLPALGEALTTRFPFSIPWDVTRAIRLLAAPPKTPRFEVDFIAPIAYRFGGNLGNTKIVLDFQEYEIIGQVSRWTSTIGFCLLLASGTKKLIWTA